MHWLCCSDVGLTRGGGGGAGAAYPQQQLQQVVHLPHNLPAGNNTTLPFLILMSFKKGCILFMILYTYKIRYPNLRNT